MVKSIRHIEAALGNADKKPCADELENLYAARKSIVAKRDIKKVKHLQKITLYHGMQEEEFLRQNGMMYWVKWLSGIL